MQQSDNVKNENSTRSQKRKRKRSFFAMGVDVWRYQIISMLLMVVPALLLDNLMSALVDSSGAPVTTANMSAMFNWRLLVFILLAIALILVFIVFEIFGQIYLSRDILNGEESHVFREVGQGFKSVRRFLSPKGLLFALYITIVVPICGVGFSISLTESFKIPNFITSVIFSKPLTAILFVALIAVLVIISIRWIFAIHAMLLDNMKAGDALKKSVSLMKANWKDFFKKFVVIAIYSALILIASHFLCKALPEYILNRTGQDLPAGLFVDVTGQGLNDTESAVLGYRIAGALCVFLGRYINLFVTLLVASNIVVRLTDRYFAYTGKEPERNVEVSEKKFVLRKVAFFTVPAAIAAGAILIGIFYSQIPLFDYDSMPQIIAHRTGGTMASENSLEGVDESVKKGVYGAETDIQRTKDGAYIINHDSSFARLTGVDKTPGEMTLSEIKELRIKDTTGSGAILEVPTLEELLDRCKGRITAFVEFKGNGVDDKMADDAVAAALERNMKDEVVFISLNYNVLDYTKKTYPEFKTGVLLFGGMGDISKLNCDIILMEEEMSTFWQIMQIKAAGKQTGVWTVNKEAGMKRFMNSGADFIITDEIPMAIRVQEAMRKRTDVQVLVDRIEFLL